MPCLRTIPDTDKREQTAGGCKSEYVMRHVKVTAAHWACVCVCEGTVKQPDHMLCYHPHNA